MEVHFHVFTLLLSRLTILGLVHLKSCIYMGKCTLPLLCFWRHVDEF